MPVRTDMTNQNQKIEALRKIIQDNRPFLSNLDAWCGINKKSTDEVLIMAIHTYCDNYFLIEKESKRLVYVSPEEVSICFHRLVEINYPEMLKARTEINEILDLENDRQDEFKKPAFH